MNRKVAPRQRTSRRPALVFVVATAILGLFTIPSAAQLGEGSVSSLPEPPATTTTPPSIVTRPPEEPATTPQTTPGTTTTTTPTTTTPSTTTPSTTTPSTTLPVATGPTLAPVCGVADGQGAGCRLIAYYGTPLSKLMGILGRTDPNTMLASLRKQTAEWQAADPATPTKCTLELIAIVAQAAPGASGLYRARADAAVVRKVLGWARSAGCLLLIDIQVGWSSVAAELSYLEPFLSEPDVHLALDPEWDMQPGAKPGSRIGTMDAADINAAVALLDRLVKEKKLPPKLLVVHRFRDFMVTNPSKINTPETIRLVVNMDGFGTPGRKLDSYRVALRGMPTKLTGFKLFTNPKLDTPLLQPSQVVGGQIRPVPVFINYQ
jgi:hypothetical protein